jgi:hypothetical protein
VVKGMPDGHGTYIDSRGGLYVLVRGARLLDGKKLFGQLTGTIVKFPPGGGRFISSGRAKIPLSEGNKPKGSPQLKLGYQGSVWVQGHRWMYSGIGLCRPGPCQCWNCRFTVDRLGRSFAPENLRSQIAVLDAAGNLITRVGRYGNVDDGAPLVEKGGPQKARAIGGDEVALMYANYVAAHTDRRLFIADPGNLRILSVKLGYHAEEKVKLKNVPDEAGGR